MPTVVAVGAVASGTGAITPALPAGIATDDILVIVVESENQAVTPPTGYAQVTGSAVIVSTGTVTRLSIFWKRATASETAQAIADPGDHCVGRMIAIRGCVTTGNPWNITAAATELVSDTTVSIPGFTTTAPDCLILSAFSTGQDVASTANASVFANASLVNVTERMDNWVIDGLGGGFAVATGEKAVAGLVNATTATVGTANFKALMSIAFQGAGATLKTLAESGSGGGHAVTVAATATLAATGTAADALTVNQGTLPVTLPDAGSGSDALRVAAAPRLAESGSGSDSLRVAAAVQLRDAATAGGGATTTLALIADVHLSPPTTFLQQEVRDRAIGLNPALVLMAGDITYDGTTSQWNTDFNDVWGGDKAIIRPAPGNHDQPWNSTGAAPYEAYWGSALVGSGTNGHYYSFDIGGWHLVSLDVAEGTVDLTSGTVQYNWLAADLAANAAKPTMVYWHEARYSAETFYGDLTDEGQLDGWDLLLTFPQVEAVFCGHAHTFQRWKRQDNAGNADAVNGIRQFIVATGGYSWKGGQVARGNNEFWYGRGNPIAGVDGTNLGPYGITRLLLGPTSYTVDFIRSTDGVVLDTVTQSIRVPLAEQLTVDADVGITLADAGAASDALRVAAAVPVTQAGSAADQAAVAAAVPLTQPGAASDAVTVDQAAAKALPDTGAGADTATVTAALTLAQTATGADALSVDQGATAKTLAETGAGADTLRATAALTLAEVASAADALTLAALLSVTDSGAGSDLLSVAAVAKGRGRVLVDVGAYGGVRIGAD